ncbi:MAG: hypothetical protein HY819_13050 [Acidobacteria bacterium]|nr:hypothetical protein [Acidobacteriota bacterium]
MAIEILKQEKAITNCIVKNEKGVMCAGHLKEYLTATEELKKQIPAKHSIYRCRRCLALYTMPEQDHLHASKSGSLLAPQKL